MANSIKGLGMKMAKVAVYKRTGKYNDELEFKFNSIVKITDDKALGRNSNSFDITNPAINFWFDYPIKKSTIPIQTDDTIEFEIETIIGLSTTEIENDYSKVPIMSVLSLDDVIFWNDHEYDINYVRWRDDFGERYIRANVSYRK